ncbi:MAG: GAF domain-containing protein [Xanthomonadales bacterium]|nr:GAF domain-containing protein [Gammaproteobacteria bacterium]MBT8055092.1 GAF domain-containing protein [Gammaproteobacteria bacterium]NND58245.1 GAF domain-containing protein [Xanthomonadales bacterium]NNK51686.1 GAF domain-containing protein [Xanthomonadales bacterium]
MFDSESLGPGTSFEDIVGQAAALLSGQNDRVANAANLSALLYHALDRVNWVGFYFLKGDQLVVGPFQGKPACVSIPMGKGVCGKAAATRTVQRIADVHAFEGHIACDAASRSEIVLPLVCDGELIGVLDLDSPDSSRFDENDEQFLQEIANVYVRSLT